MYGAVSQGEHVNIANYQSALNVADGLISDLHAIIHGNGLGKFKGVPSCASWFPTKTPPVSVEENSLSEVKSSSLPSNVRESSTLLRLTARKPSGFFGSIPLLPALDV